MPAPSSPLPLLPALAVHRRVLAVSSPGEDREMAQERTVAALRVVVPSCLLPSERGTDTGVLPTRLINTRRRKRRGGCRCCRRYRPREAAYTRVHTRAHIHTHCRGEEGRRASLQIATPHCGVTRACYDTALASLEWCPRALLLSPSLVPSRGPLPPMPSLVPSAATVSTSLRTSFTRV